MDLHSLPQRAERLERLTCGELEPPCYGSVWPVVWGAGVRIPGLPDSLFLIVCDSIPRTPRVMPQTVTRMCDSNTRNRK